MPLVIFTPRVSVSRMCTPSVIPLACSVRRISAVISSSDGTSVERQGLGRPAQPGQVLVQPEDPAVVEPQALPDRVAALHGRVERADRGLVPVGQVPADVDDQVAVPLVESLQHRSLLLARLISMIWVPEAVYVRTRYPDHGIAGTAG